MIDNTNELKYLPKDVGFSGKLITAYDGVLISEVDFSTLENMRYTLANPKAVPGMTKITTSPQTTYQRHRAGIHYVKRHPYENQIFYQAWDTNYVASIIHGMDSTIDPPNQAAINTEMYTLTKAYASVAYAVGDIVIVASEAGTYFYECIIAGTADVGTSLTSFNEFDVCVSGTATFVKRRGDLNGKFSYSPDGSIIFTNGWHNLHYGGKNFKIGKFFNFDGAEDRDSFRYDYTDILRRTNYKEATKAVLHPTVNKLLNCVGLYNLSANANDTSGVTGGPYNGTATAITYAAYNPMHTHEACALFNGTTSKILISNGAAVSFPTKEWSVDLWFKAAELPARQTLISQGRLSGGKFDRWQLDNVIDTTNYPPQQTSMLDGEEHGLSGAIIEPPTILPTTVTKSHIEFCIYNSDVLKYTLAQGYSNNTGYIELAGSTATDKDTSWGQVNLVAVDVWHWVKITEGYTSVPVLNSKGKTVIQTGYFFQLTVDSSTTQSLTKATAAHTLYATTGVMCIGCVSNYASSPTYSNYFKGYIQDVRILTANTLNKNTPPISPWVSDTKTYVMIGSPVPVVGFNFYVSVKNASSIALTVSYWDKTAFTAMSGVVDGTAGLTQSGIISFPSNYDIAFPSFYASTMLYWYKFEWDGLDATTALAYISAITEFQPVPDIWDGEYRSITLGYSHKGDDEDEKHWNDITSAILEADANSSGMMVPTDYGEEGEFKYTYNRDTAIKLSLWVAANELYLGSIEPLSGLYFKIPQDTGNSHNGDIIVSRWTGTWEIINGVHDETQSDRAIPLATSGIVTWDPNEEDEWKTKVRGDVYLYFYKVQWTEKIAAKVFVDQIAGIPKPTKLSGWKYSQDWLGCTWLVGNMNGDMNKIMSSQPGSSCCFNGSERGDYVIGRYDEFTGVGTLYSRYAEGAMESMVLTKRKEVWVLSGLEPAKVTRRKVSDRFGCNAPRSFVVCDMGTDDQKVRKSVILWQSAEGIIQFDNGSLSVISGDIEDIFLTKYTSGTNRINTTYSHLSHAWYDPSYKEYHFVYAKGSAITPDTEMVYDLLKNKWFKIIRGSTCMLGISVEDIIGNQYLYGSFDAVTGVTGAGYVERLEYGNTFDGTAIVCTLETADKPDLETLMKKGETREIKIIGKAIATTATVAVTLYKDGKTTGTALGTITQSVSDSRYWIWNQSLTKKGTFTRIKMIVSGTDVPSCFEPLAMGYGKKFIRRET